MICQKFGGEFVKRFHLSPIFLCVRLNRVNTNFYGDHMVIIYDNKHAFIFVNVCLQRHWS